MENRRYRLAVFASHPVQYHVPMYRALANHPEIDLTVLYGSVQGVQPYFDSGFHQRIQWDIDLLSGYRSVFLKNLAPFASPDRFWGLLNVGILWELWRDRYDAILLHGYAHATSWLTLLGAKLTGTRCFLRGETSLTNTKPTLFRRLKTFFLQRFLHQMDFCLAIGSRSVDFYRAYGVPKEKIVWSPYSVDQDWFRDCISKMRENRENFRNRLGLPQDTLVVLYVGKLIPRKRPADLIEAMGRLKKPATLLLVGEGCLRAELEALIKRRNLFPYVRLVGFKNQTELPAYYALADLFVLPSGYEPWGVVINEALCAGLPVVTTTAVVAAVDLVKSGENGFLYEAGDVPRLSWCLQQLLEDNQLRTCMSERSRHFIKDWSPQASVQGVLEALSRFHGKG